MQVAHHMTRSLLGPGKVSLMQINTAPLVTAEDPRASREALASEAEMSEPQGSEGRFIAGSALLQELRDCAPSGQFTLQWLLLSLAGCSSQSGAFNVQGKPVSGYVVIMHLKAKRQGLMLSLGGDAVVIQMNQ